MGQSTLQIGDGATGNVSISAALSFSLVRELIIDSGAGIVNSGGSLAVSYLALEATTGIGDSPALAIGGASLAFFNSTSGAVNITSTGGLGIAAVGPLSTSGNAGGATDLIATAASDLYGDITITVNLTSNGDLSITAVDITVYPNVSVSSTSGNVKLVASGNAGFQLGGSVTFYQQSLVQSATVVIDFGGSGKGYGLIQGSLQTTAANSMPEIDGGSAGTILTIDYISGVTLPEGLNFDGGSGSGNSLTASDIDSTTSHTYAISLNSIVRDNAQPVLYSNVSSVTVAGGNLGNTFSVTPVVLPFSGFNPGTSEPAVTFDIQGGASGGARILLSVQRIRSLTSLNRNRLEHLAAHTLEAYRKTETGCSPTRPSRSSISTIPLPSMPKPGLIPPTAPRRSTA